MAHGKLLIITAFISLLILPLMLAYGWDYYSSPAYLLDNEWVLFTVLFLMFFAIIYYTVNKSFKNNVISAVIALGLSLFISLATAKKGILAGYGYGLDSWILFIAALIIVAFLIRFASNSFGRAGAIAAVIVIWIIILFMDPYNFLPDSLMSSPEFMSFYENILKNPISLLALIILAAMFSKPRENNVRLHSIIF
jgi:hypothetical protein